MELVHVKQWSGLLRVLIQVYDTSLPPPSYSMQPLLSLVSVWFPSLVTRRPTDRNLSMHTKRMPHERKRQRRLLFRQRETLKIIIVWFWLFVSWWKLEGGGEFRMRSVTVYVWRWIWFPLCTQENNWDHLNQPPWAIQRKPVPRSFKCFPCVSTSWYGQGVESCHMQI